MREMMRMGMRIIYEEHKLIGICFKRDWVELLILQFFFLFFSMKRVQMRLKTAKTRKLF
jgi:hypothetical protein